MSKMLRYEIMQIISTMTNSRSCCRSSAAQLLMLRLVASALIVGTLLIGCSLFSEMKEDCARASAAIEAEFGGKVQIGWKVENGVLQYVNVVFVEPPQTSLSPSTLKTRIVEIVCENVRRKPVNVTVTF